MGQDLFINKRKSYYKVLAKQFEATREKSIQGMPAKIKSIKISGKKKTCD